MGELNQHLSSLDDATDGERSFRRIVAEELPGLCHDLTAVLHIVDASNVEGFKTSIPQRILNLEFSAAIAAIFQECELQDEVLSIRYHSSVSQFSKRFTSVIQCDFHYQAGHEIVVGGKIEDFLQELQSTDSPVNIIDFVPPSELKMCFR